MPAAPDDTREFARRRLEADQALARLGADGWLAEHTEAPFRSKRYRTLVGLTQGWDRRDRQEVARVSTLVADLVRKVGAREVYGPLGIGGHVDHRVAFEAVKRGVDGLPRGTRVGFYEERPYVFVRESLALRLAELQWSAVFTPRPLAARARDFLKDFFAAPYVRAWHTPPSQRLRITAHHAFLFSRNPLSSWVTQAMVYHFGENAREEIRHVVACHESRLHEFFGDLGGWEAMSDAYHRRIGYPNRYVERYWKLPERKWQELRT